jgi:hypothetical protein
MAGLAMKQVFCAHGGGTPNGRGGGTGGEPWGLGKPPNPPEVPWVPKASSFLALVRPPNLDQKPALAGGSSVLCLALLGTSVAPVSSLRRA